MAVSYGLYHQLGANQQIQSLADKHQQLSQYSLEELAEKASKQTISVNDLLNELRLRLEATPNDSQAWMKLGQLLTLTSQGSNAKGEEQANNKSLRNIAKQAFNRASQQGSSEQQVNARIEVAKTYLNHSDFENALDQLNLVLLKNNQHEGALMMKGLTESRLERHQDAIDTWSYLASRRQQESESIQLINSLIDKERTRLHLAQTQYIEITIDNFSNLDLQSFTKAFAIVRPLAGGAPLAVKAIEIEQLPQIVKMTPQNLMLQDANFWQVIDLKIEIRLSTTGFAKPEAGDKFGQISPIQGLSPTKNYTITIDQVVN